MGLPTDGTTTNVVVAAGAATAPLQSRCTSPDPSITATDGTTRHAYHHPSQQQASTTVSTAVFALSAATTILPNKTTSMQPQQAQPPMANS